MAFSGFPKMYFSTDIFWILFIRAVVVHNHSANVNAFKILLDKFEGDKTHYITLPNPPHHHHKKYFCFFILLIYFKIFVIVYWKKMKFVFPAFIFEVSNISFSSKERYIAWSDLHKVYNKDNALNAKLRKALKLTFKSLHPSDK